MPRPVDRRSRRAARLARAAGRVEASFAGPPPAADGTGTSSTGSSTGTRDGPSSSSSTDAASRSPSSDVSISAWSSLCALSSPRWTSSYGAGGRGQREARRGRGRAGQSRSVGPQRAPGRPGRHPTTGRRSRGSRRRAAGRRSPTSHRSPPTVRAVPRPVARPGSRPRPRLLDEGRSARTGDRADLVQKGHPLRAAVPPGLAVAVQHDRRSGSSASTVRATASQPIGSPTAVIDEAS